MSPRSGCLPSVEGKPTKLVKHVREKGKPNKQLSRCVTSGKRC